MLIEPIHKSSGGVCKSQVEFIYKDDVETWPESYGLKQLTEIELVSGKNWTPIPFTRSTLDPSEQSKFSKGGKFHDRQIPGIINLGSAARRFKLSEVEDMPIIVRFNDKNGETKVFGSPEHPSSLIVLGRKTGNVNGSRNEISVIIKNSGITPYLKASD